MKTITFVTQKGGSGKTTLCLNFAVAAVKAGKKVFIIDLDPQATAERWYDRRDTDDDLPQVKRLNVTQMEGAINSLAQKKFDLILIDTPGRDEPGATAAIKIADFCLIPCRPTPADMEATPTTIETVKRLDKKFAFVLTQTPARSFRIAEAEKALSVYGLVAPNPIVSRSVYQDAQGAGLGVTEMEPEGKAAEEINKLWNWTLKRINRG